MTNVKPGSALRSTGPGGRMDRRHFVSLVSGGAVAVGALPLLSRSSAAQTATPIVLVLPADIQSLDKSEVNLLNDANISNNVYDQLLQFDENFALQPMLASEFQLVDDTTWEFRLREDIQFHDGTPFTSQSVAATLDWSKRPTAKVANLVKDMTAEIVDEFTVLIKTTTANATLPNTWAWLDIYPDDVASRTAIGQNPVGTGPFTFGEWVQGQHVRLNLNPNYWGSRSTIPEVQFRFVTEPSTRLAMLFNGEADLITNLNPEDVDPILARGGLEVIESPGLRKMAVVISHLEEPMTDLRVRQAMNYAVDRDSIIENLFLGYAVKSIGMTQNVIPGHVAELDTYYDYDPDKARALLAEAGYESGFDTTLYTPSGTFPKDQEAAEAIANQLQEVGVRATVEPLEFGAFFSMLGGMEMEGLGHMRWGNTAGDPSEQYLYNLWSKGVRHYVTDPGVDERFETAQQTMDRDERIALMSELEEYVIQEVVPWVWLYDLDNLFGKSDRFAWEPRTAQETIDLRGTEITE